jgi:thiol-disulfide isomerase/thioredoxin
MMGSALMIRKISPALMLGASLGLSYIVPMASGSADDSPVPMPNILLADGSGMPFPLSRYRGNVLVVEFWSNSCPACLQDLTFLNRLQGDMPGKSLIAIAISEDDIGMPAIRAALSRQKLGFLKPFADPQGTAAAALGLRGLPSSILVDRHGNVVAHFEGPQPWDRADYQKRINFLMSKPYP